MLRQEFKMICWPSKKEVVLIATLVFVLNTVVCAAILTLDTVINSAIWHVNEYIRVIG